MMTNQLNLVQTIADDNFMAEFNTYLASYELVQLPALVTARNDAREAGAIAKEARRADQARQAEQAQVVDYLKSAPGAANFPKKLIVRYFFISGCLFFAGPFQQRNPSRKKMSAAARPENCLISSMWLLGARARS